MMYSTTMIMHILGATASASNIDIKDCPDACRVPGSTVGRVSTEGWTKRTELCDADHVWNYAELGPEAGINARSWGQSHVRCRDGQLISYPGVGGDNPQVSTRLCLDKTKVNAREEALAKLFNETFQGKIADRDEGLRRMNVVARATASRRDVVTGEEQDTVEWDNMVVALRQYFEEDKPKWVDGRLDVTQVQRYAVFKGMQIMPDDKEGHFALKAIETLAASGTDPISKLIREKADADLLISMEQGGRSLQIWPGQDLEGDVYPEETGLYSNLGNIAIKTQLLQRNENTTCLNAVATEEQRRDGTLPTSYFSKDACRKELRDLETLPKHRHESASEGMPKLVQGGLYVAFSTFYFAAGNSGIAKQVMPVREALKKVTESLASDGKCPEGLVADKHPKIPTELLCMQRLVLEMMLEEMVKKSEGIEADILFTKKIGGKKLSWTVGVAETMKPTIRRGQHIVVLDVGSTGTKVYGARHNLDGSWSDMTKWAENEDGDLVTVTAPTEKLRLRL